MRIIQLLQKPQLRGAEIFACQLSNHLIKQEHEVVVVSIFLGDSLLPFKGETIALNRPLSKRFLDFKGWWEFNEIIKKFDPDIIQANAADTLKFAVSSKIIFSWKQPLIYRNANKMGDFVTTRIKWKLNNFYLSKLAYVISVSKECEKDFQQTFNFPGDRIRTVEIGVEDQQIGKIPNDLQDIFKKGKVITHIGGFVPEKNHQGLINIFRSVLEEFPDIQLLLIGKGKLENEIREKARELGIENSVYFLGYRTDVLNILYHSDVFVLPSLIEGLPAVILEAMYCETPVVAYEVGGIGEVVISRETGWLVEKNNEIGFKESIKTILSNSSEVVKLTSSAKKMITTRFLNAKIAKRFFKAYQHVLKEKFLY